jgi:hypothetical protein
MSTSKLLLNKLKCILDKKDLNVAKLGRSPGEAILQVYDSRVEQYG